MSIRDHKQIGDICIWDHEPWPCPTAQVVAEVAETVRTTDPEPNCCDVDAARWQERNDIADEIAAITGGGSD